MEVIAKGFEPIGEPLDGAHIDFGNNRYYLIAFGPKKPSVMLRSTGPGEKASPSEEEGQGFALSGKAMTAVGAKGSPAIHISTTVRTTRHLLEIPFPNYPFGAGKQPEGQKDDPQEQNPRCPGQCLARGFTPSFGVMVDPKCQSDSDQKAKVPNHK